MARSHTPLPRAPVVCPGGCGGKGGRCVGLTTSSPSCVDRLEILASLRLFEALSQNAFLTSGVLLQLLVAKLLVSTFLGRNDTELAGSKPDLGILQFLSERILQWSDRYKETNMYVRASLPYQLRARTRHGNCASVRYSYGVQWESGDISTRTLLISFLRSPAKYRREWASTHSQFCLL